MKSNFPFIHSLSTIGIKQHFDCDYIFHPFRTDFSGESGSGKSMVADMIQLILVGSGAYRSSTESNRIRDPKGMVLEAKSRHHGIGYIFLNIKTGHNKFIVIGAYLESSHNKVQQFIIQEGYDWEQTLIPLSKPFYYQNMLLDGKIVAIEKLQDHLKEVALKPLSRRKYHLLLFENEILSLDLNKSKTLDSYASILRSFSRGKGFKTDSESLKKFLFGDDDQNRLMAKYQEEVHAINNDFHQHLRFSEEINLIRNKQSLIERIVEQHKEYINKQIEYLYSKNWYWKGLCDSYNIELDGVLKKYQRVSLEENLIRKKQTELEISSLEELSGYKTALSKLRGMRHEFELKTKKLEQFQESKREEKRIVDKVEEWLTINENSLEKTKVWYKIEREKSKNKEILIEFIGYLKNENQFEMFEQSEWCTNFAEKKGKYDAELKKIENGIKKLKALSKFSNLSDEDSLANWAISNLTLPLPHELESVLIHFQELPREEPVRKEEERYLPIPKRLFNNLRIKHKAKRGNGFWIELDGVYEFVEYTPTRHFNTSNSKGLIDFFKDTSSSVSEQLEQLIEQKDKIILLKNTLFDFYGVEKAVELYAVKEKVISYEPIAGLDLSSTEFEHYLQIYNDGDRIKEEYNKAKFEYEDFLSKNATYQKEVNMLSQNISQIESNFQVPLLSEKDIINFLRQKKDSLAKIMESIPQNQSNESLLRKIEKELFPQRVSLSNVYQLKAERTNLIDKIKLNKKTIQEKLEGAKKKLDEAGLEYFLTFNRKFDFSEDEEIKVDVNPETGEGSLKEQFKQLEATFRAEYNLAVQNIDENTLIEEYHVGMLAHKPLIREAS